MSMAQLQAELDCSKAAYQSASALNMLKSHSTRLQWSSNLSRLHLPTVVLCNSISTTALADCCVVHFHLQAA